MSDHWTTVIYPQASSSNEAVVLENMWRDRVLKTQYLSNALIFFRFFPLDIIMKITLHNTSSMRAVEARRTSNDGMYSLLCSVRR